MGRWPGACWRPYADDSPFNQRLPRRPRLDPRSDAIVRRVTGWGEPAELRAGVAGTEGDWQHPIYYPDGNDPEFQIHCVEDWGTCEIEGMRVRIPDAARAAAGSDGHLTVVDQDSGWEYDFWQVRRKPRGGGRLVISWGGRTRIEGDGLGSDANAAHYGSLAGIIRAEEMRRGRIDHALFMLVRCDSGRKVYPARGLGLPCDQLSRGALAGHALPAGPVARRDRRAGSPRVEEDDPSGDGRLRPVRGRHHRGHAVEHLVRVGRQLHQLRAPGPLRELRPRRRRSAARRTTPYYFDWASGINWRRHLRVVDPCVAERSC